MRIKPLYLLLTLSFVFTSLSAQETRFEVAFMECLYKYSDDNGAQIKKAISDFEGLLVKEGIFKATDGQGYVDFFSQMKDTDQFRFAPSVSFKAVMDNLKEPNEGYKECQEQLEYNPSDFEKKSNALQRLSSSAYWNNRLSPSNIAQEVLENFAKEDFNLRLYKLVILITLEDLKADLNGGLRDYLPDEEAKEVIVKQEQILSLKLNQAGEVLLVEVQLDAISNEDLETFVYSWVGLHEALAVIKLEYDTKTDFDRYQEVISIIKGAVDKLRSDSGFNLYGKKWEELTYDQKEYLKNLYPKNIK